MLLEVRLETVFPFVFVTVILGFLSIFKKSQASSPFEALNFACLSRCQRDVRPPLQTRWGRSPFYMVSREDSDMPYPCEMKDEHAFKPRQGNLAFFRVRASRFPFHLRQQTQGPSHIPIAEGNLLLRCLWKVGIALHSKPGNQLSYGVDLGCTELFSSCSAEIAAPLFLRQCLRESLELPEEVKPIVVYDMKQGLALEPIQWNWDSSRFDLGYTELFHIPAMISVSF